MAIEQTSAWERVQQLGLESVSLVELLTLMVTREVSDVERNEPNVRQLFRDYHAAMFKDLSHQELKSAGGLEHFEATRLLAAVELGRRAGIASQGPKSEPVTSSEMAYDVFKHLSDQKQEHFCAAFFDSKARLIAQKVVHIGTLNMSVVGAREVFREAVRHNAASVIVAHNHPSGDPEPSPEDIKVTQSLKKAGELLDIPLLDHLVIGQEPKYVSLNERGLL